jgi:membrane protein YqaA with SNARE-associated domain
MKKLVHGCFVAMMLLVCFGQATLCTGPAERGWAGLQLQKEYAHACF